MRVWGKVLINHKIRLDTVGEYISYGVPDEGKWEEIIHDLCQQLDLSRPVLLEKHFRDLRQFSRVVFKADDFMEPVDFDRFEVELIQEKKKRSKDPYAWA